jgi:hypothetical protein
MRLMALLFDPLRRAPHQVNIIPTKVVPISISNITDDVVSVKGEGPPLKPLRATRPNFWDSLLRGGGEWM